MLQLGMGGCVSLAIACVTRCAYTIVRQHSNSISCQHISTRHSAESFYCLWCQLHSQQFSICMSRLDLLLPHTTFNSPIRVLQDYLNIELDSHRNQLIQLELLLTAAMFALALVTVIAGIFGMNLNNKHEDSYSAFVMVRVPLLTAGHIFLTETNPHQCVYRTWPE